MHRTLGYLPRKTERQKSSPYTKSVPATGRLAKGPSQRDSIGRAGVIAWSLLGVLLLAGVVLWILALLRDIFPPLALALVLVFLLNPWVTALQRRGVRRGLGTAAIYILFITIVAIAFSFLMPPLGRQVNELVNRLPEIRDNTIRSAERLADRVGLSLEDLGLGSLLGQEEPSAAPPAPGEEESPPLPPFLVDIGNRLFTGAGRFATGALHAVVNFILAPVFAAYLLIDLPKIHKAFLHYLPPGYKDEWLPLFERAGQAVGSFFRGQLLVAAIVGALSCIAFLIIGLPFWLPIGLLAGFFNIIPLVGPFVGGGVAVLVGGMTEGLDTALWAAGAMLVVQQIDNHFISPKVMGWAVRLHPVAVMVALILGLSLGGPLGMLLAVPMLGVLKIVAVHYYETRVLANWDYYPVTNGEGLVKKAGEGSEIPPGPEDAEVESLPRAKSAGEDEAEPPPQITRTPRKTSRGGRKTKKEGVAAEIKRSG
jgi:predicted PurR-regulated permease PerM